MAHKTIEDLDLLPSRESMCKNKFLKERRRNYYQGDYHKTGDYYPYTILKRILSKFVGKSVNDAFSKYCEIVPKYQQKFFWEEFLPKRWMTVRKYYIDENNLIQSTIKPKRKSYEIRSFDIKYGWKHIKTGEVVPRRYHYTDNYEYGVIEGILYKFQYKNYLYYRCFNEELSKKRKVLREQKKKQQQKQYSFITNLEKKIIKDKQLDIITRDRLGFSELSFTKNKQL